VRQLICRSKDRGRVLLATAALVGLAAPAAAATFNFMAIGDGANFLASDGPRTGFEGTWDDVVGDMMFDDGIGLRATGNNIAGPAHALIDNGNAGLGVCSSVSCVSGVPGANTGDDNLNRAEEVLTFGFDQTVFVTGMRIQNAIHEPANGDFQFHGQTFSVLNGLVDPAALALIAPAASFSQRFVPGGTEIYVSSVTVAPIPLPAGLMLLGAGLAALGLVRWRRIMG
jgi:hypothetical protein